MYHNIIKMYHNIIKIYHNNYINSINNLNNRNSNKILMIYRIMLKLFHVSYKYLIKS